jgi:hypothetical protein
MDDIIPTVPQSWQYKLLVWQVEKGIIESPFVE